MSTTATLHDHRNELQRGMRRHGLLLKPAVKALPAIGSTDGQGDAAIAHAKFFWSGTHRFYVTEFDGTDLLYGFLSTGVGEGEWGYQSLRELASAKDMRFGGIPAVERDCSYEATTVKQAKLNDRV
jgi:Protein of unknown function (DUF2958)